MDRLTSLLCVLSVTLCCVNAEPQNDPQAAVDRTENLVSNIMISNPADIIANTIEKRGSDHDDTCTEEYKKIEGHTMCMGQSEDVAKHGVSKADQNRIVDLHNDLRRSILPPATDLASLVWDAKIAAVAQKWAMQCEFGHDKHREIPEYGLAIGQNAAAGQRHWNDVVMAWFGEISMFKYGQNPDVYLGKGNWTKIGHFTQIVQNETFVIGCGYAYCPHTAFGRFYVCNYGSGQTLISHPYTEGKRCHDCPKTCNNGLCDCGGKTCWNGGIMDLNTCRCTCDELYSGSTCDKLDCPDQDPSYCGKTWPVAYCKEYTNVPRACPFMCGLCKSNKKSKSKTSTVFISEQGCRYAGRRPDAVTCKGYGVDGKDSRVCRSTGGYLTCNHCEMYYNVKTDYCPIMCGICDSPYTPPRCGGKKCLNKGSLHPEKCVCMCKAPYTGKHCETAICPNIEHISCQNYPVSYCKKFDDMVGLCPRLCGACT